MASESTVVSDHSPAPEQHVEKVNEEVKKIEQEGLPASSGSGAEEKLKAEDLPSQPAPSAELEEKIEERQIEPSLAEAVKKTDEMPVSDVSVEDKPDASGVPESVADSIESQQEDQPKIESIEKQPEEQPAIEAVEKQPEEAPKMGDVTEPSVVADSAKGQPEEQLPTESVEKLPQMQPPVEVAEKQPEEQPKITDTPEPSVEEVEKTEQVEVLPVKESETVEVKDTENSQADPKKEEIMQPAPEVEDKPEEQSEAAEQVEPKESVKVEIAKDEETLTDKTEVPQLKEEQTTQEEPVVTESSDQITPTTMEAQDPPTFVTEDANVDDKERESSGSNVAEGLSKEAVAESGKIELECEEKNVKTGEENEEKKVISEESDEPKTDKVEDVSSSISPTEVTEKSLEVDNTSRDIELAAENGEEGIKDETEKNGEVEGKVDEVTTSTVKKPVEDPKKSETEVKGEKTEQTDETKLEKEKEAGEIAKPDVPAPESLANDGDETKISQEPHKEEPSTKPTKQSNNLIAKVKQSLVKAKKAIIGKSPNSKTVSSETKGDIKDK